MSLSKPVIIPLRAISSQLSLRWNADRLFDAIEKKRGKKIIVDFKGIDFVGRSFVQQYLLRKNRTAKTVLEKNRSLDVRKMFTMVKERKTNARSISHHEFERVEIVTAP